MREEEIKQLEIDKIHWRDLYWLECEKTKKLKSDLAFKETMLDNVRAEYENLQNVIKKLKNRVKEHTTYSVKAEFIKKFGE